MLTLIDIEVGSGAGISHYWSKMKARPYTYGTHYGPHDMKVQEWGTGNTRLQTAARMGLYFEVVPKIAVAEGINAVRSMLPYVWADEEVANRVHGKHAWLDAMTFYGREFDERTQTFRNTPRHDWSSHYADMTRYRAVPYQGRSGILARPGQAQLPTVGNNQYSAFDAGNEQSVDVTHGFHRGSSPWTS
jgi:hypothetical protein